MPRYFNRPWDEPRGDEHDAWGTSIWYFEIDESRYATRQLEVYASGDTLAYDRDYADDDYGGLGDQALDGDEWNELEITAAEFEAVWHAAQPINRRAT